MKGAYGFRFTGVDLPGLVDAPVSWPEVSVTIAGAAAPAAAVVGDERAVLGLPDGGQAVLDRRSATAVLHPLGPVDPGWVVHPALAYLAAVFSRWHGRHSLHGGAFVAGGGAWGVLGGHGDGKSTTLAWLAEAGVSILADDMLAIAGGTVFAGPRTLDLRAGAAPFLDAAGHMVRDGARRRLSLDSGALEQPLRGWFALSWGDRVEARPLAPGERLAALLGHLHPGRTANGVRLLDLLRLPGYELTRPRALDSLPDAAAELMATARRSGEGIEPSNRGAATACRF